MTKRAVLSTAIMVLGIVCAMYAVGLLAELAWLIGAHSLRPQDYGGPDWHWYLGLAIAQPALVLTAGVVLLRWGDSIAARLVPDDSSIQVLGGREWGRFVLGLALRVMGVVCLVHGLPRLVAIVTAFAATSYGQRYDHEVERIATGGWFSREIVASIVTVIIGGYLLTGAKHLVRLLYPAQESGTEAPEEK